jgi:putative copper export protein
VHATVADAVLVVPQFASVCCIVGDRYRPRPGVIVPAAVMLLAMLMPVVQAGPSWTILTAALLLFLAPLPVVRRRRRDGRRAEPMDVHRALSAVVMAGMLLIGHASELAGGGSHAHALVLTAVLGAGVIGYCAFSGWLLRYEWAREDRRAVRSGEVFAMTVAVVGMTLAM